MIGNPGDPLATQISSNAMEVFTADCWFLTGPTASGKSEVALTIAEMRQAEIVAMDSMTLYRGMDIGTAKPTLADRARVPHHLIDVLDVSGSASLAWYLGEAKRACDEIRSRGRRPMFVGGTPLYLKALLRGFFSGPPAEYALRQQLESLGAEQLFARLVAVDPIAAQRIDRRDMRRQIRALEVYDLTGRTISDWQQQFDRPANPSPAVVCLSRPRAELYRRINARTVAMLEAGWIEEVQMLLDCNQPLGREPSQAVGMREISAHLAGSLDFCAMLERIQTRTRQFCKRQLTWFRHLCECRILETSESEPRAALVERIMTELETRCPISSKVD